MPKYYCDYCDTFLTHDSPSVRRTHTAGRKHKDNVRFYYQKWMEAQAQNMIDMTTRAFKVNNGILPFPPRPPVPMANPFYPGAPVPGAPGLAVPPPPGVVPPFVPVRPVDGSKVVPGTNAPPPPPVLFPPGNPAAYMIPPPPMMVPPPPGIMPPPPK